MSAVQKKESLCAECFNFNCAWHRCFEPVEGWTAEPTTVWMNSHTVQSYCVTACPEFKERAVPKWQHLRQKDMRALGLTGDQIRTHDEKIIATAAAAFGFEVRPVERGTQKIFEYRRATI